MFLERTGPSGRQLRRPFWAICQKKGKKEREEREEREEGEEGEEGETIQKLSEVVNKIRIPKINQDWKIRKHNDCIYK